MERNLWERIVNTIIDNFDIGDYDPFVWYSKREIKKYKANLNKGFEDYELAKSVNEQIRHGRTKYLSPKEAIALDRLRYNFPDIFKENDHELKKPRTKDYLDMEAQSILEAGDALEDKRKAFSKAEERTEGLNDWNKYKSITTYIKKYEDEQYDAKFVPDNSHDVGGGSNPLDDVD